MSCGKMLQNPGRNWCESECCMRNRQRILCLLIYVWLQVGCVAFYSSRLPGGQRFCRNCKLLMKTVLFRVAEDLAIRAETRPVVFVTKAIIVSEGVGTWPVVSSRCRFEVQLSCISW
jgi:hypothetical protein